MAPSFTRTQRVRLVTFFSLVLLYILSSLAHISLTQTAKYQANRPKPSVLNLLEPCIPGAPPPDTSLCRHCTLLSSSIYSTCVECNATLPTRCDHRSDKERVDSNARHDVRLFQYRRDFVNAYGRTQGWFMWLMPRSDYIGDRAPFAFVDDIVGWALEQAPLAVDPVALCCSFAFAFVLIAMILALIYNKMCTDADYRDQANELAHRASSAITGSAERAAAADAVAEASGATMPDLWGLDRKNQ